MSVYYEIFEHLTVNNISSDEHNTKAKTIKTFCDWAAKLGALMLEDSADVIRMELTADGKEFSFAGNCPNDEYNTLLKAIASANDFDLIAHYEYVWRGADSIFADELDSFTLSSLFERLSEDELDGVFYSMWNNADCGEGAGALVAFGIYNSKLYTGSVDFETVNALPDGEWYAETDIAADSADLPPEQAIRAVQICTMFNGLTLNETESAYITVSANKLSYHMNDVLLHGQDDFDKLIKLYAELRAIVPQTDSLGEYADTHGSHARVMHVSYSDTNVPTVKIAEIK